MSSINERKTFVTNAAKQKIATDLWNTDRKEDLRKEDYKYIARNHPSDDIKNQAEALSKITKRMPRKDLLGPKMTQVRRSQITEIKHRFVEWCLEKKTFTYDELYEEFASGYISMDLLQDWIQELYKSGKLKKRINRFNKHVEKSKPSRSFPTNPFYGI